MKGIVALPLSRHKISSNTCKATVAVKNTMLMVQDKQCRGYMQDRCGDNSPTYGWYTQALPLRAAQKHCTTNNSVVCHHSL